MTSEPHEERRWEPAEPALPATSWDSSPGQAPVLRNGMGLAAMVLGILSLLFMVLFPPVGLILGLLGLIFGILGVRRVRRGEAVNRGQALAGAITGGLGLVVSVVLIVIVGVFVSTHRTQIDQYTRCLQNAHSNKQAQNACAQQFQNSVRGR